MNDRQRLYGFIKLFCLEKGEFTLSSGNKTNYYFNIKQLTMFSEALRSLGELIHYYTEDLKNIRAFGGMESGAIPLVTSTLSVYQQRNKYRDGFFIRKTPRTHGINKKIEGNIPSPSNVILLEDVVTTGNSVMKAVEAVRELNCNPVMILSVVDRNGGAEELFAKEEIPYYYLFNSKSFIE